MLSAHNGNYRFITLQAALKRAAFAYAVRNRVMISYLNTHFDTKRIGMGVRFYIVKML
jgi:hypothetical protein